jgi:hypothetical protein
MVRILYARLENVRVIKNDPNNVKSHLVSWIHSFARLTVKTPFDRP